MNECIYIPHIHVSWRFTILLIEIGRQLVNTQAKILRESKAKILRESLGLITEASA